MKPDLGEFQKNIVAMHGSLGQAWLDGLSATRMKLNQVWGFRDLGPLSDLNFNYVGRVELMPDHQPAILKIAPKPESIAREVLWLRRFPGVAVEVVRAEASAALLEHCQPGTSLLGTEDDEATRTIAEVIRSLQRTRVLDTSFPHLAGLLKDFSALEDIAEPCLLARARDQFRELTTESQSDVLLHGDLHHENILRHGNGWRVIDPHGYRGDPAAEVGALMRNPNRAFPRQRTLKDTLARRLAILAEELPFDKQRMHAWALTLTMLSAAWTVQDSKTRPLHELAIASALAEIG